MTGLNNRWKDNDITITTKCRIVSALVFPVALYGCESGNSSLCLSCVVALW